MHGNYFKKRILIAFCNKKLMYFGKLASRHIFLLAMYMNDAKKIWQNLSYNLMPNFWRDYNLTRYMWWQASEGIIIIVCTAS